MGSLFSYKLFYGFEVCRNKIIIETVPTAGRRVDHDGDETENCIEDDPPDTDGIVDQHCAASETVFAEFNGVGLVRF